MNSITESRTVQVGWVQSSYQGNMELTVSHYLQLAYTLKGVELIVFPELVLHEYFCLTEEDAFLDYARTIEDPIFTGFKELAQSMNAVVVVPYYEKSGSHYYNSTVVYERDGTIAGEYQKMHIPYDPGFYEKYYFEEGTKGFTPIVTSVGTLGVLICWDQWFPEAARIMALKGADFLLYPTAIGWDDTEPDSLNDEQLDAWTTTMRAHSIANGVHTIAVNRIGIEGTISFWGNSFLCKPNGQLENNATTQEEAVVHTIDLSDNRAHLDVWPFFRDRRVDAFESLLEKGVAKVQTGMVCKRTWHE
ncbi:MAG: carbon-nitrogen hydrolase [Fibrobacterales bacterium]